jgi:hypothetical protein
MTNSIDCRPSGRSPFGLRPNPVLAPVADADKTRKQSEWFRLATPAVLNEKEIGEAEYAQPPKVQSAL